MIIDIYIMVNIRAEIEIKNKEFEPKLKLVGALATSSCNSGQEYVYLL